MPLNTRYSSMDYFTILAIEVLLYLGLSHIFSVVLRWSRLTICLAAPLLYVLVSHRALFWAHLCTLHTSVYCSFMSCEWFLWFKWHCVCRDCIEDWFSSNRLLLNSAKMEIFVYRQDMYNKSPVTSFEFLNADHPLDYCWCTRCTSWLSSSFNFTCF